MYLTEELGQMWNMKCCSVVDNYWLDYTNIPPCGLDQLYDKSNTHCRAFIHWTVWGIYVGYSTGYIVFVSKSIYQSNLLMATAIVIFLYLLLHCVYILNLITNLNLVRHFKKSVQNGSLSI